VVKIPACAKPQTVSGYCKTVTSFIKTGTLKTENRVSFTINFSKMANQVLRDSRGVKIGEIQEAGGKLIIRDARGIKKGEYDPKTNTTRNERGVKVGTGNLLTSLL